MATILSIFSLSILTFLLKCEVLAMASSVQEFDREESSGLIPKVQNNSQNKSAKVYSTSMMLKEFVVPRIVRDGPCTHQYEILYENSKAATRWTGTLETATWFLKGGAALTGTTSGIIGILDIVDKAHAPIASASLSFASTVLVILDVICQKKIDSYHHANKDLEAFLDLKTKEISDSLSGSKKINLSLLKSAIIKRYNYLYNTRDKENIYPEEACSTYRDSSQSDPEDFSTIEDFNAVGVQ
jgi:hypothetical protein